MKDTTLMLFVSLFFRIACECSPEHSTYEECFSAEITEDEIFSGESVDDYTCCYLRQLPSQDGECFLIKNTDKPKYPDVLDNAGIPHEIFACSEDELPDQSKSDSCFLLGPIKESYCFTRSISDREMRDYDNVNIKCCYLAFNNIEECSPVDPANIDEFKKNFIEDNLKFFNYVIENLEVICGDSNGNPNIDTNNHGNPNIDTNNHGNPNIDTNNPDDNSNKSFAKIFGISYFIWLIILFV